MKIAITAASGQLGAAIVDATVSRVGPADVIAVARTPKKVKRTDVEVRAGSYDDRPQLTQAFAGVDTVLLVSGMDAPDRRVVQHRNVIEAAKDAGVQRLVYVSVQGPEASTGFSPIVQSNRQTEADLKASGLAWTIGRNGIYIEPDVEYLETYKARGEIANCGGEGRCGYCTRPELAAAYANMLTTKGHEGKQYNLHGEPITQRQLASFLNETFGLSLRYRDMTVADYRAERVAELGEFIGTVIAGIYEGIRGGHFDSPSDFEAAAGRRHQTWPAFFAALKATAAAPPVVEA